MSHHLTRLGLLGCILTGMLHCSTSSLCVEHPMDERCRPELLQDAQEGSPRCTNLKLKARRITGAAPLSLSADDGAWRFMLMGNLTAEPGGPVSNTPTAFSALAQRGSLQTLDEVWFHFALPRDLLPDGETAVFRLHDDVWTSADLNVKLGKVKGSVSLRSMPLGLSQVTTLALDDNPLIRHIGAAGNKIWLLRSGSADGDSRNFDRARVIGSDLKFEPLLLPVRMNRYKDLLADFAAERIVFLDPRVMTNPERQMAVTNCPLPQEDLQDCSVATPLLMPRAQAFALSSDASRGAVIDESGTLRVAQMSIAKDPMLKWVDVATNLKNAKWLRFADLNGDAADDLIAVYRTAPYAVRVFKSKPGSNTYEYDTSLSTLVATALGSSELSALTVGQLSTGSVLIAFVIRDTLTILESQCGERFSPKPAITFTIPADHDWASGALAIGEVTGGGRPDLILGFTTKHKGKDEYLQHLRVYPDL